MKTEAGQIFFVYAASLLYKSGAGMVARNPPFYITSEVNRTTKHWLFIIQTLEQITYNYAVFSGRSKHALLFSTTNYAYKNDNNIKRCKYRENAP